MKLLFLKVMRDLFRDKTRAVMSILAIVIGTIAFGVILFSYSIISRELKNVFDSVNPSSANVVVDKVDNNLISLTKGYKNIIDFEEKAFYELRIMTGKDQWKTLHLFAVKDFSKMKINKISLISGSMTPKNNEILIERDALGVANSSINDTISVILPNDQTHDFNVVGVVNDITVHPASIHNTVYAYISYDTLNNLGLQGNRLDLIISANKFDRAGILKECNDFINFIEKKGYSLKNIDVSKSPGVNIHSDEYEASLFIFQIFSIISFIFGCMIMSGLISTILSNQIRQIGVLKAIGAKTNKVILIYMLSMSILALITVALSLPICIIISKYLCTILMRLGNMQVLDSSINPDLFLIFCSLGISLPIIVAFFPILKGLKVTVKDAINDNGINNSININGRFFKWSNNFLKVFSRPVLLSLRNAVRRRGRFWMNISTLTLGGSLFVAIVTSMISIQSTLSENLNALKYDYQVNTSSNISQEALQQAVKTIPEIEKYETWEVSGGNLIYNDGKVGNLYPVQAPSFDTKMFIPEILEGRWLSQNDTNSIIVSHKFYISEPGYKLGDTVTFKIGNTTNQYKIVGTVKELGSPTIYISKKGFELFMPKETKQNSIKITTTSKIKDRDKKLLYHKIEDILKDYGIGILQSESKREMYRILSGHFSVTLLSFLVIAFMVVIVAAFGLTSTMSVQVMERTKEIGIMKAMGATSKQIMRIITSESIFICLISWIASIVVGIPIGIIAANVLGKITIDMPLSLDYTKYVLPYIIWLLITITLGNYASRTAAKRAAKISVKESLVFD